MTTIFSRLKDSSGPGDETKTTIEQSPAYADPTVAFLAQGGAAQAGELKPDEAVVGGLGRHLGIFSTTFLMCVILSYQFLRAKYFSGATLLTLPSIGRIIGTGIFSTPSSITKSVGSVGAALMFWVLGLALSFAGLCIWLEFGCMIPRSGGEKVYLEAAYKRPKLLATVVFAFQVILLGFSGMSCSQSSGIWKL